MNRAALLLTLSAGACTVTPAPTREELARALGVVAPADLTHIACQAVDGHPADFACRWRQRDGRHWQGWQSYLSLSGSGWHVATEPSRRP